MGKQGLSVLVMDDERVCREIAGAMLQLLGHNVMTCNNGEEACYRYKAAKDSGAPFDVVIIDLVMHGGVGGIDVAREILAFDPHAQLIVSSGFSNESVLADPIGFGFKTSMPKPYTLDQLQETLIALQGNPISN